MIAPILVGSAALAFHLDRLKITHNIEPMDIDFIVSDKVEAEKIIAELELSEDCTRLPTAHTPKFSVNTEVVKYGGLPVEISYPVSHDCTTADLIRESKNWACMISKLGITCKVAPLNVLYSLKWSHRFLRNSPHFLKTMRTIKNLQKLPGVGPHDTDWLDRRMKETYDYSHPNLKVKKADFFNSNFDYIYDHDSIHEAVKLLEKPAYTFYMDGNSEVNCSKESFFAAEKTIRLLGVLEETYVLALERSQIPNNFEIDPRLSFNIALEKVCTSITSGWFRQYAWENYEIVSRMYDASYVDKFKHALKMGRIKDFK